MTIFASRPHRLDRRVKELTQEKEELLKSSKVQSTTMESVKVQIETLLKVRLLFVSVWTPPLFNILRLDRVRNRQEGRRTHSCHHNFTRRHPFELNG